MKNNIWKTLLMIEEQCTSLGSEVTYSVIEIKQIWIIFPVISLTVWDDLTNIPKSINITYMLLQSSYMQKWENIQIFIFSFKLSTVLQYKSGIFCITPTTKMQKDINFNS
jgi:hypothetical protein